MNDGEQFVKNNQEIPSLSPMPSYEEDNPRVETMLPAVSAEKMKAEREEERKDADSKYARNRDMWVTIAGLILVLLLITLYALAAFIAERNDYVTSLLYLLNSVVMLIIGYIFGTKINR